jgi:hypothetical protein
MKSGRLTRNVPLVSGAGLAVVPMAFAATPSLAAADCGEGTEVSAGICEKAYTTAGDYTFTVPASVSKMSAVLVGGGGTGLSDPSAPMAYGGGGGGVAFVDSVDISGPISISVGSGAEFIYSPDDPVFVPGEPTTVGANTAGAGGTYPSPISGSPQNLPGWTPELSLVGSGGGAGGTPTTCAGGPGLAASSVAAGSSLFPALLGELELGQGGSCQGSTPPGAAGPGKGGNASVGVVSDAGNDGAVILRWAAASLPDTGINAQPWVIGASVAAVLGGAVLASGALRVRRQGRHSL